MNYNNKNKRMIKKATLSEIKSTLKKVFFKREHLLYDVRKTD